MNIKTSYLYQALDPHVAALTVKSLTKLIKSKKLEFDTIVFRGMSGALIAPSIALALGKPLVMIRKPNDGSHSGAILEGNAEINKYIIIDDFISTGDTIKSILLALETFREGLSFNCQGVFLYRYDYASKGQPVVRTIKYMKGVEQITIDVNTYGVWVNHECRLISYDGYAYIDGKKVR